MSNTNNTPCVPISVAQPCAPCEQVGPCDSITPCEGCLPPDYDSEGCIVKTPFECLKWTCDPITSVGIVAGDDGCQVITKLITSFSSGSLNFSNGLTKTGSDVKLGGALTQNTTIDPGAYVFSLLTNNIQFSGFPNTVDNSGVSSPLNFLYTDGSGMLKSAPLAEAVSAGLDVSDSGTIDFSITQSGSKMIISGQGKLSPDAGNTLELRGNGFYVPTVAQTATPPANPTSSVQFNNAGAFGGSSNLTYNSTTNTLTAISSNGSVNDGAVLNVELDSGVGTTEPFGLKIVNTKPYTVTNAGEYYGIGFKAYNQSSATGTEGFIDLKGYRRNAANNGNEWISLVRWGRTGFAMSISEDERVWSFGGRTVLSFNGTVGTTNLPAISYGIKLDNLTTGDGIALELHGRNATTGEVVVGPIYDGQTNAHISRLVLRTANIAAPYSEIIFRKGLSYEMGRWTNAGSLVVGSNPASLGNPATAEASAVLQVDSTTKGFLPPRMTGAQVEAIVGPAEGLLVYCTDTSGTTVNSKGWWGYNGTTWVKLN